jgi:hypothetical protein
MSSSNSSEMNNQIGMAFSCVMNEDMSILKAENGCRRFIVHMTTEESSTLRQL